jgi:hypothetical protein
MAILDVLGEGGNRGRDQFLGYEVGRSEPVLLNVYGAPASIPRNEFRQPM